MGEKGTGKTAYAVFLSNSNYKETRSSINNITETDYKKFIYLKRKDHLKISDYSDIWRTILLLITADHLIKREPSNILLFDKFRNLKLTIDDYYRNAFSPEVVYALDFIENYQVAAKLLSKYAKASGTVGAEVKTQGANFQTNLMYIQKMFESGISALKLNKDHIVFIDGIDIRPSQIPYEDYIECVKGLAQATWSLNSEFFANIRDSKGRVKIMILLRPDIFSSLRYQNPNAKVRDNAVFLDWRTTYQDYRNSRIFKLIDGLLGKQQDGVSRYVETGEAWDHYFPYEVPNLMIAEKMDNPFIGFLRYSLYRPRDIISYLLILQDYVKLHQQEQTHFTHKSFIKCQAECSDYLLGEIKDQLDFYYSDADFEGLKLFFSYLDGKRSFDYKTFSFVYPQYQKVVERRENAIREIVAGPEEFLQFLYSLNVIGYQEITKGGETFIHWCFRDRTRINIDPRVRFRLTYSVHPGLARALRVGGR